MGHLRIKWADKCNTCHALPVRHLSCHKQAAVLHLETYCTCSAGVTCFCPLHTAIRAHGACPGGLCKFSHHIAPKPQRLGAQRARLRGCHAASGTHNAQVGDAVRVRRSHSRELWQRRGFGEELPGARCDSAADGGTGACGGHAPGAAQRRTLTAAAVVCNAVGRAVGNAVR